MHLHVAGMTDDGLKIIEVWDSPEHIERYIEESGLGQALEETEVPEPKVTEFEVHKLDWVR